MDAKRAKTKAARERRQERLTSKKQSNEAETEQAAPAATEKKA